MGSCSHARQEEAASRALERLEGAQAGLSAGVTPDALLTDVEEALSALGELTGASVREDITDRIFQRFCVGKLRGARGPSGPRAETVEKWHKCLFATRGCMACGTRFLSK